jgi:hypothetical protein
MFWKYRFSVYKQCIYYIFFYTPLRLFIDFAKNLWRVFLGLLWQAGDDGGLKMHRILARSQLRDLYPDIRTCFIYVQMHHFGLSDAIKLILDDPQVSLQSVGKADSFFVRTKDLLNIHDSRVGSFYFQSQFYFSDRVLTLPLDKLQSLADEHILNLRADKELMHSKKVIIIGNHPRSGGTFFTQVNSMIRRTHSEILIY